MKRALSVVAVLLAVLLGAAAYFLYAPAPDWPTDGLQRDTVEVQGRQRSYQVYAPAGVKPGARVLLALHPSRGSGDMMRSQVGGALERLAVRDGAIVVYPDGHEGHFNDCRRVASYSARTLQVDDVTFLRRIVERLVAQQGVDPKRVDALGYSNGAHMALRLALETPDLVRGVVAIAANMPGPGNTDCNTTGPVSKRIVLIEGTRDPVNPYLGGDVTLFGFGSRGEVLSAQASADWWVKRLGLAPAGDREVAAFDRITVRQQDWTAASGQVRLVSLVGAGHTIPQADYRFPRLVGPTYLRDDVLSDAWQLLDQR